MELYRTESGEPEADVLERVRSADVVTLASGSAARAFAELTGTSATVAVMGSQTERAAREAGFTRIVTAREASLEALVEAAATALDA